MAKTLSFSRSWWCKLLFVASVDRKNAHSLYPYSPAQRASPRAEPSATDLAIPFCSGNFRAFCVVVPTGNVAISCSPSPSATAYSSSPDPDSLPSPWPSPLPEAFVAPGFSRHLYLVSSCLFRLPLVRGTVLSERSKSQTVYAVRPRAPTLSGPFFVSFPNFEPIPIYSEVVVDLSSRIPTFHYLLRNSEQKHFRAGRRVSNIE